MLNERLIVVGFNGPLSAAPSSAGKIRKKGATVRIPRWAA